MVEECSCIKKKHPDRERDDVKRAGLFGGTFNPVHFGHLRCALEVMEGFGLDRVDFIPAAHPPHKTNREIAAGTDRLAMLSMAIGKTPGFSVSDTELRRSGRSYTIDTINQWIGLPQQSIRHFLIIGADAFLEIDTWKDFGKIFEVIALIVMSRPGNPRSGRNRAFEGFGDYVRRRVSSAYRFNEEKNGFFHESMKPVYLFPVTSLDISATTIRRLAAGGRSIRYLVPDPVAAYIQEKRLYE